MGDIFDQVHAEAQGDVFDAIHAEAQQQQSAAAAEPEPDIMPVAEFAGFTPAPGKLENYTAALPVAGGAAGFVLGGPGGAAVGAGLGRLGQQAINARYGSEDVPSTPLGAAADVGLEMGLAGGGAKLAQTLPGAVARVMPSRLRQAAAPLFNEASQATRDLQYFVDPNRAQSIALQAKELQAAGRTMPRVMQRFLMRVQHADATPLSFDEARRFYSAAGELSASEKTTYTAAMKRLLHQFRVELGKDIAAAAGQAGKGAQYGEAMADWRRAAQIGNVTDTVKKWALPAAAGAAGVKAYYNLYDLLSGK